nr:helix-turn-helix transcriptional regulator [uncultured Blautia sp.]
MNRIKQLREEKKITQIRLSIELEVSQETISAYEKEKYYPSAKSLMKLREIFGVSIDYIMGLSDTRYDPLTTADLSETEVHIVNLYRKIDNSDKERALAYLEGYVSALNEEKTG